MLTLTPTLTQSIHTLLQSASLLSKSERTALQAVLTPASPGLSLNMLEIIHKELNISVPTLIQGSTLRVPAFEKLPASLNPQQELRKQHLKLRAEEREFARMVSNVDTRQMHAKQHRAGAAVSLQSASFGLHIIIGMAFGFLAGYLLARTVYEGTETVRIVGGIIGMVGTLIMEVVLYIIRDEKARLKSEMANKKIKEGKSIGLVKMNQEKKKRKESWRTVEEMSFVYMSDLFHMEEVPFKSRDNKKSKVQPHIQNKFEWTGLGTGLMNVCVYSTQATTYDRTHV